MDFSQRFNKRRMAHNRGFTLVELMVVVMIIGILAAISLPQVVQRMRNRRGTQAVQTVALMYRNARLRAMGRGFAVLVSYTAGLGFKVRETMPSIGTASCTPSLPLTCSNTNWLNPLATQMVDQFNPEDYATTTAIVSDQTLVQDEGYLDICYSPHGRTYMRTAVGNPLTATTDVFRLRLSGGHLETSIDESDPPDYAHHRYLIEIMPNGMARSSL